MSEVHTNVPLSCPSWCRSHTAADIDRLGGGVTSLHESAVLPWSDDGRNIAGIRRIDEFADSHVEGIYIGNPQDHLWDITADEARRLAAALLILADEFDPPLHSPRGQP